MAFLSYWKMLGLIDDITMLHDGEFEIDNILDLIAAYCLST